MQILGEIQHTWSMMSLSYEMHTSTGTPLLKADENLIDTLEDNQVTFSISQLSLAEITSSLDQFSLVMVRSDQNSLALF